MENRFRLGMVWDGTNFNDRAILITPSYGYVDISHRCLSLCEIKNKACRVCWDYTLSLTKSPNKIESYVTITPLICLHF